MKVRIISHLALLAVSIALGDAALAVTDSELNYHGIRYACTGVSEESRHNTTWATYPVKLVFANGSGEYITDAAVTISDTSGTPLFEAQCPSPWLLVDLPPGHYRVTVVEHQVYERTIALTVGYGGQTEHVIHFPEIM